MKILSGLLLRLDDQPDSQGDVFSPDCVVELTRDNEIPIILDADGGKLSNIFGMAQVEHYGNVLVFKGKLFKAKEDQLNYELCKLFYPCVSGKILKRDGNMISHFRVTDVVLSTKNSDPNIPHVHIEILEDKDELEEVKTSSLTSEDMEELKSLEIVTGDNL